MESDEEPPDDLRVRLTWPQPSSSGAPFDARDREETPDLTPAEGTKPVMAPPPREPVARPEAAPEESKEPPAGRRGLGRWAADRRAAAQRAADAREQAAREAAERAAAERAEAKRAAAERAAAKRAGDPRGGRPSGQPSSGGPADLAGGRAAADRAATEAAHAQWAAAEAAQAQRAAAERVAAQRAAAEREAAQRAAAERAAAQRQAAERAAAARTATPEPARSATAEERAAAVRAAEAQAADRAETQRVAQAAALRAAAERAAAQQAALDRAEAQRADAQRAAAEREAAEGAAARAQAEAVAERAAAQRAEAARAEAEQAAATAAAERAAAEQAAEEARNKADADRAAAQEIADKVAREAQARLDAARLAAESAPGPANARPLLTVDAEAVEEDEEGDADHGREHASRPTVTTQELILAGRTDSLQAALASIALRIDALTSTTSTFRNLVSDRITDYAEQVGRLATSAAGDLDDYRHLHERAIDAVRRSVTDIEENVRRVNRSVGDLDAKVNALVAAVHDTGDAIDEWSHERDQVSDGLVRSLERIEDGLTELTEGKGAASFVRLDEVVVSLIAERDRQTAAWKQLEQLVVGLADDRERTADVLARLERGIADMTVGRERGLTKALARLEARIEEIGAAMTGISADELAATLSRLDTRLKEMSTDLVVGRDRDVTRALTQVSGQVDELAALVAENRVDLSPLEARLNRLARTPAAPASIDLTEMYARFDDLAEAVLERRGAEVGNGVPPDAAWGATLDRLDRVLPSLESLPTGAGGGVAGDEMLGRLDDLGQQLGEQLEALRRRVTLRGRPSGQEIDAETIAAIADAVAARLNGHFADSERPEPHEPAQSEPPWPTPDNIVNAGHRPRRIRDQWRDT